MAIGYFLVGVYVLVGFWLIPQLPFIKKAGLSKKELRLLLAFKMICSLLGAFYLGKFIYSDYVVYNAEGKLQYDLLLKNPQLFFTDFTGDLKTYGPGRLFETKDSFWGYLRFSLLYKFLAILNIITKGNFYLNTILFSSFVFFGHIAFYRIYSELYKGHKLKILFTCFLLPSVLLYTSCVHKDGLIFIAIGITSYVFHRILQAYKPLSIKYIYCFVLSCAIIFLFRNYVVVAIIPAIIAALLCKVFHVKKKWVLIISYSIFSVLFFLSGFNKSPLNLPAAVAARKADFATLESGNTTIAMNDLQPTFKSFVLNLPQAINHSLMRPYLWEFPQPAVLLTAIELFFYQMIIVLFIFYRKTPTAPLHIFNIFGLLFVFNMMLIIGYTIPNLGAIVRYRSIFWVFIICPAMCNIDWQRLLPFQKVTAENDTVKKG